MPYPNWGCKAVTQAASRAKAVAMIEITIADSLPERAQLSALILIRLTDGGKL
ncbi:hypothetical protein [Parasphingopyxis sp.]|uniref:hypothetical protein n=1 Tax=Parasphingopyxis sp. TaxID=1920299 RepID=UPI002631FCC7|nr:hypothetical protein [Parasphingopyxis sp.]